ncbi:hypothetical protein G3576_30355 [Roseomonas stagni]|uniref:Uncharacterized protein n=1 Tax=Falsiroseomonas algicola TaxID=2716930 RepID=A0A6M1LWD1_9PROT|nr:hypothetical protein [Falsiroseomonas algicola]NGM24329.1 hypothetical protein [Falsiroseomonas algicola]
MKMDRAMISSATKEASERWLSDFPKVSALDRDPRGLPIPQNVTVDPKNGKPVFAVRDAEREIELLYSKKCSVTGTNLDSNDVWFVTTPDLAFVPFGAIQDAPICGEAKEFTLRVCPYFGLSNYTRLTDGQAQAIIPALSATIPSDHRTPTEFVAVQVTGFQVRFTRQGLRYYPSRHYRKIELWSKQIRQRVVEGREVRSAIEEGLRKGLQIPPDQWPAWSRSTLDGSLNGCWPWDQSEEKEQLIQVARSAR